MVRFCCNEDKEGMKLEIASLSQNISSHVRRSRDTHERFHACNSIFFAPTTNVSLDAFAFHISLCVCAQLYHSQCQQKSCNGYWYWQHRPVETDGLYYTR